MPVLILIVSLCCESGCATTPTTTRPSQNPDFAAAAPAKQPSWFERMLGTSLAEMAKQSGSPK